MSRTRTTRDEWEIQSNHGYGWDVETTESTLTDAREQLRTYRENVTVPVRIVKRRVPLTERGT